MNDERWLPAFDAEICAALADLSPAGVRSMVREMAFRLALWERYSKVAS